MQMTVDVLFVRLLVSLVYMELLMEYQVGCPGHSVPEHDWPAKRRNKMMKVNLKLKKTQNQNVLSLVYFGFCFLRVRVSELVEGDLNDILISSLMVKGQV